jgi:hypothetical protein
MLGFNGGLMGVRRTPTGSAASGLWFQNEQSVARRAAIWPAGPDPDFASVSLLLSFDGTNGSTTFTDASSNNHAITTYGDAQISTARWPFSGSGSSLLLDGTVDKLSLPQALPSSLQLDFGSYTVEAFVYTTSTATQTVLGNLDNQTGNGHYWMVINSTFNGLHTIQWFSPNNAIYQWGSATLATDQWHHIAATYDGTSTRVFLNGTLLTAGSNSGSSNRNNNVPFYIGASHNVGNLDYTLGGATIHGFIGNISNVRITKGVARYTANFTPLTAPFPNF